MREYRWQDPAPEAVRNIRARRHVRVDRAWQKLLPLEYGSVYVRPGVVTGYLTGAPVLTEWPGKRERCDPHTQMETAASPGFHLASTSRSDSPTGDQS